jgi:carbamoyl-phosphate synthase small subunit
MTDLSQIKQPAGASAVLVFADGTVLWGKGFGAETTTVAEICFNTSMTGYQEIMTDPSYAGQIINFTFPHIGNVGTTREDMETTTPKSRGMIVRENVTAPSNWRSTQALQDWMVEQNLPGICGVDTRAITRYIRDHGAPNAVLCHNAAGEFDLEALHKKAAEWPGLEGMDLAADVTCKKPYTWDDGVWDLQSGYTKKINNKYHVVAFDYGAKNNILRCLVNAGCNVTVVPAQTPAEDVLKMNPDGVFLSNGPGDPAATGEYAVPCIRTLMDAGLPIFGICLGHQMLAIALGGQTRKMHLGHRGANQPVKDLETGKVEITSQNHGFEVVRDSLPKDVIETHVSLFDGSNEGLRHKTRPCFSVQYHPEASPGPMDSYYLFDRFVEMIEKTKKKKAA